MIYGLSIPRLHYAALTASASLLILVACSSDARDPEGIEAEMPAIHLEQTAELLVDGQNARRAGYFEAIQNCLAGGIPTQHLSDDEVVLVGVTRYEMWLDSTSETARVRSWDAVPISPGAICQFKLEMSGLLSSLSSTSFVEQDLSTGVREENPVEDPHALQRFSVSIEDEPAPSGYQGPVAMQVAGQPCDEWTLPNQTRQCVWSGGRAWGFNSMAAGDDHRPSSSAFVLKSEPGSGNGYRVTTQTMTVGKPFAAPVPAIEMGL